MVRLRGTLAFVLGCLLTFGGAYESFTNLGVMTSVVLWGFVCLLGMFPLVYGVAAIVNDPAGGETGERGTAPGKTGNPFDRGP